ncbi:hypothetical protein ACQZ6C_08200 [Rhizobium rhizogenes]
MSGETLAGDSVDVAIIGAGAAGVGAAQFLGERSVNGAGRRIVTRSKQMKRHSFPPVL